MAQKLEAAQRELDALNQLIDYGEYRPVNAAGEPIHPNKIRSEILRYLAVTKISKAKFMNEIGGVNNKSFGTFMNGSYKDAWSATSNSTYELAARFFAVKNLEDKIAELSSNSNENGKRPHNSLCNSSSSTTDPAADSSDRRHGSSGNVAKKLEAAQRELDALNQLIDYGEYRPVNAAGKPIHPNKIRSEILGYLAVTKISQAKFMNEIGGVNNKSFGTFMNGSYKDAWSATSNSTYELAARFFAVKNLEDKIAELSSGSSQKSKKSRS